MVAIKNRHVFARGMLQGIVQIAGLGVVALGAPQVVRTRAFGKLPEFVAAAVVKQVDIKLVARPVHAEGREYGGPDHLERLVVARDKDVHRWPLAQLGRQRRWLALHWPDRLDIAQHHHHPGVDFGRQQSQPEHEIPEVLEVEGLGQAPPDVARGGDDRKHRQDDARQVTRQVSHDQRGQEHQQEHQKLLVPVQRRGGVEQAQHTDQNHEQDLDRQPHRRNRIGQALEEPALPLEVTAVVAPLQARQRPYRLSQATTQLVSDVPLVLRQGLRLNQKRLVQQATQLGHRVRQWPQFPRGAKEQAQEPAAGAGARVRFDAQCVAERIQRGSHYAAAPGLLTCRILASTHEARPCRSWAAWLCGDCSARLRLLATASGTASSRWTR